MKVIMLFNDDGHGWIKVKRSELDDLGITDKISPLSRIDKDYVYLEEDMDAQTYLKALKKQEIRYEEHYEPWSHIRKLSFFRTDN